MRSHLIAAAQKGSSSSGRGATGGRISTADESDSGGKSDGISANGAGELGMAVLRDQRPAAMRLPLGTGSANTWK